MSAAQAAQPPGGGGGKDDPAGADAAAAWFTAAVGTPCTLVRQQAGARTAMHVRQRHSQEAVQSSSDGAGRSETIGKSRRQTCGKKAVPFSLLQQEAAVEARLRIAHLCAGRFSGCK